MAGSEAKLRSLEAREAQRRLSREQLLTPRQLEEDIEIDGLGGTVRIRSLSHAARQDIQKLALNEDGANYDTDRMAMLTIVACVVDPKLTEEDIEELRKQDASIIDELQVAIGTMNLVGRAPDLKKGSKKTQN